MRVFAEYIFCFQGSETIESNSSQEDYSTTPLFTENDCDEIYLKATKGRQVGRGVSVSHSRIKPSKNSSFTGIWYCLVLFDNHRTDDCCERNRTG
jgi:hypothetical protein